MEVADEIIVVDSGSTDATKDICGKFEKLRFIDKEWIGYSETKNFANQQADHSYILSIDADEALDESLTAMILQEKTKGLSGTYSFNRLTNYCGNWVRHGGWYPDPKLRIFPSAGTKWEGEIHEELLFETLLSNIHLNGDLLHYSYYSHQEHQERANKYSRMSAQKLHHQGKKAGPLKPLFASMFKFIQMFILKAGFLDGLTGFHIARISAAANYLKYKELRG